MPLVLAGFHDLRRAKLLVIVFWKQTLTPELLKKHVR